MKRIGLAMNRGRIDLRRDDERFNNEGADGGSWNDSFVDRV